MFSGVSDRRRPHQSEEQRNSRDGVGASGAGQVARKGTQSGSITCQQQVLLFPYRQGVRGSWLLHLPRLRGAQPDVERTLLRDDGFVRRRKRPGGNAPSLETREDKDFNGRRRGALSHSSASSRKEETSGSFCFGEEEGQRRVGLDPMGHQ